MNATFAAPGWRETVDHLDWGAVFTPIKDELLWVLESTLSDANERTAMAAQLAAGTRWFSDSFIALAIRNSDASKTQPAIRYFWSDTWSDSSMCMLIFASRSFTQAEQQEFLDEVKDHEWSCEGLTQAKAMEFLELAVYRWYALNPAGDQIMKIENAAGFFYMYPSEKRNAVEKALALH